MEILWTLLAFTACLPLTVTWAIRGGSFKPWKPGRAISLALTPLFLVLTLFFATLVWPLNLTTLALLTIAGIMFAAAQTPGWGRQMDLGRNTNPDDEWGYQIRDKLFDSKSSYARDLTGLFMRFSMFLTVSIPLYFVSPWLSIIGVYMWVAPPLFWVVEHALYWAKNRAPTYAFVEYAVGIGLAVVTAVLVGVI